tara:strand:- start:1320 stop:2378 length:1059 start_codon:yes stop_codon:yes gene_type:complete
MNERLRRLMGLLNTPMNQGGGLLGNIPQGALLGAALYGQGIQGKDPLAGLFPSYMQTAQLQKLMTPDKTPLQKNIEALGYKPGTPEYKAAFQKGLFKDSSTTLSKNLIEAGFVKGTPEYQEAMKLRTLPEGTVQYSKFGKAAKRDESLSHANFATSGIDQLITIGEIANQSPRAFGTTGAVLSFGKDLATEVEGAYKGAIDRALGDGIDSGVYEFLGDQNYAGVGPLENALSITIARNRNRTGRLMKDFVRDAKQDASLRGLGGAEKVRQKLPFIFKEFLDSARSSYKLAGWEEEEIAKALNPKIKQFNEVMSKLSAMDVSTGKKSGGRFGKKVKNRKMKQNESGVWVFVGE